MICVRTFLILLTGALLLMAAGNAFAQGHEAPQGGHADDGGRTFHGLKTLDTPLTEEAEGESHDAAAGHAEGEHKAGLPQFDPSSFASQVFWLAIAFAILYTVFSRVTLPEIGSVLQKRQAHIEGNLAKAQKLREAAEKAKERYDAAVSEAQLKSTALFSKASEEVKAKMAASMEEFKSRSNLQVQNTEEDIAKAKKDAMENINAVAAEVAALAAQKIVGISADIDQAKSVIRNINKKAA